MTTKVYKFAVLFIGMGLILGLTLPACTSEEPAVTGEPRAPAELSFEATEYANADYGFSVKYPNYWEEKPVDARLGRSLSAVLFAADPFGDSGITVRVSDAEEGQSFSEHVVAELDEGGWILPQIGSESGRTLVDAPPATELHVRFTTPDGYFVDEFVVVVEKGGKWISVEGFAVDWDIPFDEPLFSEIAYTLQFGEAVLPEEAAPPAADREGRQYLGNLSACGNRALQHVEQGASYYEQEQWEQAIAEYDKAIALDPDCAMAYNQRGYIHNRNGQFDLAVADFTRAIELNPEYVEPYTNRGYAKNMQGQYDLAIADLTRAIELAPDFAKAYGNRGHSYNRKGQFHLAIADLDKAIELDPEYAEAYNNRGYTWNMEGQFDLAIADLSKAIELDPGLAVACANRAASYCKQEQFDLAIAELTKAIALEPDYALAYNFRGYAYCQKGLWSPAIDDFNEAIELDPNLAVVYFNRGQAYTNEGQWGLATADFSKAIELDPNLTLASFNRESAYDAFASYAAKNKLCTQDGRLTELEKKFLEQPDKYTQELFDCYMAEIDAVDAELATQLAKLPYFKEIELEDVEVLEDVLYLASDPKNKAILEKLYGKGIDRKGHAIALEALLWRAFDREFDSNNPLGGPDLTLLTRLADFQAKYGELMDKIEPVDVSKPAVRGVAYLEESQGTVVKKEEDYKFDYALMRWGLRCNAVELWANEYYDVFYHVKMAQEEGLDVWLVFFPHGGRIGGTMDLEKYERLLTDLATKCQQNDVAGLWVASDLEIWYEFWGASRESGHLEYGPPGGPRGRLPHDVDELVK
ncbi:MAG: tetratricopeptide repeat protein, partial [Chloroflexi bacterium]|nr:tetratricopeptide repeat protein [Chloroflexota bacterium]